MLTYYLTTGAGAWLAQLAGNGRLSGDDGSGESMRSGAQKALALLVGAIFVGVAGLRFQTGTDYWQYAASWASKHSQFDWRDVDFDSESGFTLLASGASWIYNDSASMFFVSSLATVGLMVWTYARYSPAFGLSILLMVLVGSWHGSFNGIRQFLAAALILSFFRLIIERQFLRFLLVVALASTLHFSAWICLLLYFIPRRVMSLPALVALIVLVAGAVTSYDLIAAVVDDVRGEVVSESSYYAERVNPLRLAVAAGPGLTYLFFARRDSMSPTGHFWANVSVVHAAVLAVALTSAYLARFAIYTQVFLPLTWAAVFVALPKQTRMWLAPLMLLLYAVFWYADVAPVSSLNPFHFLWSTDV